VKGNQPALRQDLEDLFRAIEEERRRTGGPIPPSRRREWEETGAVFSEDLDGSRKRRHGRVEEREVWALSHPERNRDMGTWGAVGEAWPGLQQAVQVRRRRQLASRTENEIEYYITSVTADEADAARLGRWIREYWQIENRLHWVRDETLGEDRSQVRTGAAPQVMAALRNLLLALLRRRSQTNIAAALRTLAARPAQAIALVLSAHLLQ